MFTLATGAATTSCDTNHGDSLLKDGVTVGEDAPSVLSVGLYKKKTQAITTTTEINDTEVSK